MIEFKTKNLQILDEDNLFPICDIGEVIIETEIEPSSMVQETLTFNHEATFSAEVDYNSDLFSHVTDAYNNPTYLEFDVSVMVQARWHKKRRINKKWLKRYGMKKDTVHMRCEVKSVGSDINRDPYCLTEHVDYYCTFDNMECVLRPDQLRKNLRIEAC